MSEWRIPRIPLQTVSTTSGDPVDGIVLVAVSEEALASLEAQLAQVTKERDEARAREAAKDAALAVYADWRNWYHPHGAESAWAFEVDGKPPVCPQALAVEALHGGKCPDGTLVFVR